MSMLNKMIPFGLYIDITLNEPLDDQRHCDTLGFIIITTHPCALCHDGGKHIALMAGQMSVK